MRLFFILLSTCCLVSCTVKPPDTAAVPQRPKQESSKTPKVDRNTLSLSEWTKSVLADDQVPNITKKILGHDGLQPIRKVKIDDKFFYISKIVLGDRPFAVAYTINIDNKIVPRLFYKSQSDGGWRSAPAIGSPSSTGWLWKGDYYDVYVEEKKVSDIEKELTLHHYTQDTKPVMPIINVLLDIESKEKGIKDSKLRKFIIDSFYYKTLAKENVITTQKELRHFMPSKDKYGDEVLLFHFLQKYMPGFGFAREITNLEKEIKAINKDYVPQTKTNVEQNIIEVLAKDESTFAILAPQTKFFPSFKHGSHSREYHTNHNLLSRGLAADILVRVFPARLSDRPIEWHMASDNVGRVWIDRIIFTDAKVNSYGTSSEIINSGYFTNKPLEYESQIGEINKKYTSDFDYQYQDLTCVLRLFQPIQNYVKNYNISINDSSLQEKCGLIERLYRLRLKEIAFKAAN